jgi:hypothetical protein
LRIDHSWSEQPDTVNVYTTTDDGTCGFRFEVGGQYLIYGTWRDSVSSYLPIPGESSGPLLPAGFLVGSCSWTSDLPEALYALHELGEPTFSRESTPLPDVSERALVAYLASEGPYFWGAVEALVNLELQAPKVVDAMRLEIHSGDPMNQIRVMMILKRLGSKAAEAVPDLVSILSRPPLSESDDILAQYAELALEDIRATTIAVPLPSKHE